MWVELSRNWLLLLGIVLRCWDCGCCSWELALPNYRPDTISVLPMRPADSFEVKGRVQCLAGSPNTGVHAPLGGSLRMGM